MSRKIIPLNKEWKYSDSYEEKYLSKDFDDSGFDVVNIPHANREIPYNYFDEKMYQFVSCYRKIVDIPVEYKGKRILIDFEGVMTYARVYINGIYVEEHKGGYTPFTVDITEKVNFGEGNVLAVQVDSTERSDIPPFGHVIDYLTYGGIYRDVNMRIVNPVFIENVFARPGDVLEDVKKLEATVFIENMRGKVSKAEIVGVLKKDGVEIARWENTLNMEEEGKHSSEILFSSLDNIELWDVDSPNLYELEILLLLDGTMVDSYETCIGFRKARITPEGFYLNGRKVKLRGLNRHQAFPYVGYAMPERVQRRDADILKNELHLNTVRTSHYPQSKCFLDRCDEIGLLVLEEIPGWQHIGDEEWKKVACHNVREMITRDWNHPSIFLWGVRINESRDDHDFYTETNRIAHELDPARQTGGIRCIDGSELLEDVYTMNDFVHSGGEKALREQKKVTGLKEYVPYMVTEFNGHMYPTKRFDQEERLVEQALRHLRVNNACSIDDHISGAIGWCAFDYNTHYDFGSGDRICYHGVMDMFRIPKFAANFYRSQVSPETEVVMEPATLWSKGDRSIGGVVPLVVFTNCDYIEMFADGKKAGRYYPQRESYPGVSYPPVVIKEMEGEWGCSWYDGEFKGYIGDKQVISKKFCKDPVPSGLMAVADDTCLNGDGIDATRVVFKIVDQCGNTMPYINDFIRLSISGSGEIIGPKEVAMIGGCIAVWVRAKEGEGEIGLKVVSSRAGTCQVRISVESKL